VRKDDLGEVAKSVWLHISPDLVFAKLQNRRIASPRKSIDGRLEKTLVAHDANGEVA
jgi:hypothetical protein